MRQVSACNRRFGQFRRLKDFRREDRITPVAVSGRRQSEERAVAWICDAIRKLVWVTDEPELFDDRLQ